MRKEALRRMSWCLIMSYVISHNDIIYIIIKSQPPIRLSYPYCLNLWRGICVNSKVGASGNIQEAAVHLEQRRASVHQA